MHGVAVDAERQSGLANERRQPVEVRRQRAADRGAGGRPHYRGDQVTLAFACHDQGTQTETCPERPYHCSPALGCPEFHHS
ncbi:MAG TPA: hypothetical protein VGP33_11595, partial [Chloroflexota bacterium]|nr:hypothetical protein [Chloroflexota bacterium]